jgi:PhnB protein
LTGALAVYIHLQGYLTFRYIKYHEQRRNAFEFYAKVLGGKIEAMMTYRSSPMAEQTPPGSRNKIMHARLTVGDKMLMASDAPPDRYEAMKGIMVTLGIDDPSEAERVFHVLSENGTVPDADSGDLLGASIRHARRSIRDTVDDQLRESRLAPAQPRRIEARNSAGVERPQVDRMRSTVDD